MQQYSNELKEFVNFLLRNQQPITMQEINQRISHKMLEEMDNLHKLSFYPNFSARKMKIYDVYTKIKKITFSGSNFDELEEELSKEIENGRLFRLVMKLGFINERPEYEASPNWSETGDRYIVKLFRDYVFHQSDEAGRPVVDVAHVLENLNKLDAGSPEKLVLLGRDGQTLIIASFRDVKQAVQSAFLELKKQQQLL